MAGQRGADHERQFQQVILLGNLTRDPQQIDVRSDLAVVELGLAMSERRGDREEAVFVDVTCFGKTAEIVERYCRKGKQVLIDGRLRYESWEDRDSGKRRSKLSVVANAVQFTGPGGSGEEVPDDRDDDRGSRRGNGGGGRFRRRGGSCSHCDVHNIQCVFRFQHPSTMWHR